MDRQPPHASGLPDGGHLPDEEAHLVRRARPRAWLPFLVTVALGVGVTATATQGAARRRRPDPASRLA